MTDIIEDTLSNGIKVVIDPSSYAGPVAIGLAFGIGARHETKEENGLSHLLEHNIFNGTDEEDSLEILLRAEDAGINLNAYTNMSLTNYLAAGMAGNENKMIDLLADIVIKSNFPEEKYDMERQVVVEEIKGYNDDPQELLNYKIEEALYPNQPAGRTVLGPVENISAMPRHTMIDYFQKNYNTNSLIVSVAGDVQPDKIMRKLEDTLADMRTGRLRQAEPAVFGPPGYHHIGREDMNQIKMTLAFPGFSNNDPEYLTTFLAANILGGGMGSPLFQEVRVKRGLVYSVYPAVSTLSDSGVFSIKLSCSPEKADTALRTIKDTLETVTQTMSEEQLNRAKTSLKLGEIYGRETVMDRMKGNAYSKTTRGGVLHLDETIATCDAVTLADVRRCFSTIISKTPTIASIGKDGYISEHIRFGL